MKKSTSQVQKRSAEAECSPMQNEPGFACGELTNPECALWTLGIAGGDIYAAIVEEVRTTLRQVRGHRFNAFKDAVKRMKTDNLIDDCEAEHITAICTMLFAVHRRKQSASEARMAIGAIYRKMLVESASGSVALAFASIAANENGPLRISVPDVAEGAVAMATEDESAILITGGMLAGILVGARIGGTAGGLAGALVGAVVGAVVAGCIDE